MTNTITVKVHPDAECTFERIAAPHEAPPAEINCICEGDCGCYLYSTALGEWEIATMKEIIEAAPQSRAVMCSFWLISGLGTLGNIGYAGYLIDFYKSVDSYNVALPSVLIALAFLYLVLNSIVYRSYITKETYKEECQNTLIGFSIFFAVVYVGLSTATITVLFCDGYITQGIISCIFFAFGSCGTGHLVLTVIIFSVTWFIMAILELIFTGIINGIYYFFYHVFCKGVCLKGDSQAAYNKNRPPGCSLYYYDKNKTTVTQCSICLCNFKNKAKVCVGRCHATHVFHAKCLNDWLKNRSTCPICTSTSGFR